MKRKTAPRVGRRFEHLESRRLLDAVPFSPAVTIAEPNIDRPEQISIVDIDGDGQQDLLIETYYREIHWYRQDASRFERELTVVGEENAIAADVTGDGLLDLLTYDFRSPNLRVNNANGELLPPRALFMFREAPFIRINAMGVHDMDNDGDLDLTMTIQTFLNERFDGFAWSENDNGSFGQPKPLVAVGRPFPHRAQPAFGDFDGDGDVDIASLTIRQPFGMTFAWHENIDGQYTRRIIDQNLQLSQDPSIRRVIDVTGDQRVELVLSFRDDSSSYNTLVYGFDENTGELVTRDEFTMGQGATNLYFADLGGDGSADVARRIDDRFDWFERQGNQFVQRDVIFTLEADQIDVAFEDINADGMVDVAFVEPEFDRVEILLNNNGGFGPKELLSESQLSEARVIDAADLNGDGLVDVIAGASSLLWYPSTDGQGSFGPAREIWTMPVSDMVVEDFDNDGDLDIAAGSRNETAWFENDGGGNFNKQVVGSGDGHVAATDVDADGDLDLVADGMTGFFNSEIPSIQFYEFDSVNRTFEPSALLADLSDLDVYQFDFEHEYAETEDIRIADLGDQGSVVVAHLELLIDRRGIVAIRIDANGQIKAPEVLIWNRTDDAWLEFGVGDLNSDGRDDVIANIYGDFRYFGWFDLQQNTVNEHLLPYCVCLIQEVADLDLDGDLDLVQPHASWTDNAEGVFQKAISRRWPRDSRGGTSFIKVVDINADQLPDLLTASENRISWIPNATPRFDFNGDSRVDVVDVDLLSAAIQDGNMDPTFDVDENGTVDSEDQSVLVTQRLFASIADVNLDGRFNSSDLVRLFQVGKFEVDTAALWSQGDFNADGRFNSADLVVGLQSGYDREVIRDDDD